MERDEVKVENKDKKFTFPIRHEVVPFSKDMTLFEIIISNLSIELIIVYKDKFYRKHISSEESFFDNFEIYTIYFFLDNNQEERFYVSFNFRPHGYQIMYSLNGLTGTCSSS